MGLRLDALCIDAHDPVRIATFWAGLLDGQVVDDPVDGPALLLDPIVGFRLRFPRTEAARTGQTPRHLDLTSSSPDDQLARVERALALGATHHDVGQGDDATHVVLADPEGNELCIIEPGNRFLAGCGLVGAVSCDGSHAVGEFWSAALGWPLVWDEGEETAVRAPHGPVISWSGPPLIPKRGPNRLSLVVAADGDRAREIDRLLGLGATRVDAEVLTDPDGNEFRVESAR